MPEISIIVPVYNPGEEKLTRCLNSIIEQTFTDFEVILVDDGSCDGSSEVCDKFCKMDTRFDVIHQENAGVSRARNRGIEESSGRYICFIDCDDYVKCEYLEILFTLVNKESADLGIGGGRTTYRKEIIAF